MPAKKVFLKKKRFRKLRELRSRLPRTTEVQVSSESVENVRTTSVAADRVVTPTASSSETLVHVHVTGDVSSSLTHSESSNALQPIVDDMNTRSNGTVTPDVSITGDDGNFQTPVGSNAGISRLSKPKAKRTKLDTVVSEDSSCASDSTAAVTDDEDNHDINDTNSGLNVAVTPDISMADDNFHTPVGSNAHVSRLSKHKAKRAKLDTVVSEDSSYASDSTADVTDNEKEDKYDKEFVFDTPIRRSTEFCFGNGPFLCQKSQLEHLIDQVNNTSHCNTENCNGQLKPVSVQMAGFGGTVRINYDCTGCIERRLTFDSSAVTAHDQPDLSLALQIGFVVAGCSYAQYHKVLAEALGMYAVSFGQFYKTLKILHPIVEDMLDEQCARAKAQMKSKPDEELGSFKRAVTNADGAWMTRGHFSQNFTYHMRDYFTNAIIYYQHLCQRGEDEILEDGMYQGTSKAAEGYGANLIAKQAKDEGMDIAVHWQDNDSSSGKVYHGIFPDCKIMLCGGHTARAHGNMLKYKLLKKRVFTTKEISELKDKYPNVVKLKCHCPKKHSPGCGCMTEKFVQVARRNFSRALRDAGTDPDKFKKRMTALHHHARDIHGWEVVTEGGTTIEQFCDFHPFWVCSCRNCKNGELACEAKPYHTTYVLSCKFHALLYKIECENRSAQASQLIHPVLGKGHTSRMESSHNVLTIFRPKSWNLQRLHYEVSTNLALLQSNVNYMNEMCGMNYHWLSDLYQRLSIPLFEGMEGVLKQLNKKRIKESELGKTEASKKRILRSLKKHRGEEQLARQNFGKTLKVSHTYGKTEKLTGDYTCSLLVKAESQTTPSRRASGNKKPCRCGSTSHSLSNHRDCPLNKKLKKAATSSDSAFTTTLKEAAVSVAHDSFDDDDHPSVAHSSSVKTESQSSCARGNKKPCKCGSTSHSLSTHRDCPLNKKLKKAAISSARRTTGAQVSCESNVAVENVAADCMMPPKAGSCRVADQHCSHHDSHKALEEASVSSARDSFDDDSNHGIHIAIARDTSDDDDDDDNDDDGYEDLFIAGPIDLCDEEGDSEGEYKGEAWSLEKDLSSDDELLYCYCKMGYKGTHQSDCPFNPGRSSRGRGRSRLPECEVVDMSDYSIQPSGPLPSPDWKQHACEMVSKWSHVPLNSESEPVKAIKCAEILPHVRDSIKGDGHCLFRALSKEITGTQKNHRAVRLAVKNFLTDVDNAKKFGKYLFQLSNGQDPVSKVTEYLADKKRCSDVWGSDKEITVAATMFQVDKLIFSQFGRQGRKWLRFSPAFSNHNCTIPSTGISLHLYHTRTRDHYDRVVLHLAE